MAIAPWPTPKAMRPAKTLYGFEAGRASALHQAFAALAGRINYRPDSLVWNAQGGQLDVLHGPSQINAQLPYQQLIVASGATDLVLPLPGWTLPGVYTLGGAQVALKFQGCVIGKKVVFLGTGPLLYLVAYQDAKAGAGVLAVLDTARFGDQFAALPALLSLPVVLTKGLYYLAWLRRHGVALHSGVRPIRVSGQDRVEALVWQDGHKEQTLTCDAIGFGYGLRSETQLADLLGCRFAFDPQQRAHLPERDAWGRSSLAGVYLAGDGAAILGADAAEAAGELSALALLADGGISVDTHRVRQLEDKLARQQRFRSGLAPAFLHQDNWAGQASDELVVCRCENVTAGDIRRSVQGSGADKLNRLKALSRVGMGRCQARMCGLAAAEILAQASGLPIAQVGRLRGQAPVKPIPLGMLQAETETETGSAAGQA
jgi:NADPH-dependent 2,4-dienoyl-CoA reductase/sulfur reductase-like enzyme